MDYIDVNRLVELRKLRGWTQRQLANEAGITHTIISRLEAGTQSDVKLSVMIAIANALDVMVDTLLIESKADIESKLEPELQATLQQIKRQPSTLQRQVAGIIRGLLQTLE